MNKKADLQDWHNPPKMMPVYAEKAQKTEELLAKGHASVKRSRTLLAALLLFAAGWTRQWELLLLIGLLVLWYFEGS